MSKHSNCIFLSQLTNMVQTQPASFIACTGVHCGLNINTGLWNKH